MVRTAVSCVGLLVALASFAGAMRAEVAQQTERPFVFYRVCNIEPGQDETAVTLAKEMVDLASSKYPAAQMSVVTGRWMTGFQEISRPVNQIRFSEQHPDPATHQDFTDILQADDDFLALQRKILGVIDVSSCVETQFRARP